MPRELASKGIINLSEKQITQLVGKVAIPNATLNLTIVDMLSVPEELWQYEDSENVFKKTSTFLDNQQRLKVLNKRTAVISEMLELLKDELESRKMGRLTWVVILLVLLELIFAIVKFFADHLQIQSRQ